MSRVIKFRLWVPTEPFGPAYLYPDDKDNRPGHTKYGDALPPRAIAMGAKHPIIHGPGCGSDSLIAEMTLDTKTILLGGDITKDLVLEQFTGILDRKGNEIYENDIVRIQHPHDVGGDFGDTLGKVFWYEHGWAHGNSNGRPPKSMWEYVTVVGNIHQKPKL